MPLRRLMPFSRADLRARADAAERHDISPPCCFADAIAAAAALARLYLRRHVT